jgi:hypothetical protein
MKNGVFWDVMPCGVSEELGASIIRATEIGELGTTLAYVRNALCISSQRASVASYG